MHEANFIHLMRLSPLNQSIERRIWVCSSTTKRYILTLMLNKRSLKEPLKRDLYHGKKITRDRLSGIG